MSIALKKKGIKTVKRNKVLRSFQWNEEWTFSKSKVSDAPPL